MNLNHNRQTSWLFTNPCNFDHGIKEKEQNSVLRAGFFSFKSNASKLVEPRCCHKLTIGITKCVLTII